MMRLHPYITRKAQAKCLRFFRFDLFGMFLSL